MLADRLAHGMQRGAAENWRVLRINFPEICAEAALRHDRADLLRIEAVDMVELPRDDERFGKVLDGCRVDASARTAMVRPSPLSASSTSKAGGSVTSQSFPCSD